MKFQFFAPEEQYANRKSSLNYPFAPEEQYLFLSQRPVRRGGQEQINYGPLFIRHSEQASRQEKRKNHIDTVEKTICLLWLKNI